jgi:N-acyl-D-amino-acid deacylase
MMAYDILIENARIVDGTGAPYFWGNVGIKHGKIVYIGNKEGLASKKINADGLVLCPGFINSHSHGDMMADLDNTFFQEVEQGVTTQIQGMCGISAAPFSKEHLDSALEIAATIVAYDFGPSAGHRYSYQDYLRMVDKPTGNNFVLMVGHGTLRAAIMGMNNSDPSPEQMEQMETLLRNCMDAGALGVSFGLQYPPGAYAKTDEMIRLASIVAAYDGVISSHVRDEGNLLVESVEEMLHVAEVSGCKLVLSHHKAINKPNWGKVSKTLSLMDKANESGYNVYCDQYPYSASSTGLKSRIPQKLHVLGEKKLVEMLRDPKQHDYMRKAILDGMTPEIRFGTTMFGASLTHPEYSGRLVKDVAEETGKDPCDLVMDVLADDHLTTNGIYFCMQDKDIEEVMRYPRTMIGSDGLYYKGCSGVHPRAFGTFLRVLGLYVREKKIITLEEAVRKMTSLPAQVYGLQTKGLIREDMDADLVLFDPETVMDQATFADPQKKGAGIKNVWINGECVVEEGIFNGTLSGRWLRHR